MKHLFNSVLLLGSLLFFAVDMHASASTARRIVKGDSVDVVNYTIAYDMTSYSAHRLMGDNDDKSKAVFHEQMKLDIGNKTAHFYSYAVFQKDSLLSAGNTGAMSSTGTTGTVNVETFTDYPATGQYSMTDKVAMDYYVLQEQMPTIDWELCPDSVATILGYTCRMARATVLGREWSAWYAEDVPFDNGPWLLRGLPGLILRAYTADGIYRFEANGMEKGVGQKPIMYKGRECEEISRESLATLYHRYYTDPIGFINRNTKIKIQIMDTSGNEAKNPTYKEYFLLDATLQKK